MHEGFFPLLFIIPRIMTCYASDIYEQIDTVLERFDFEKVHRVMQLLDWKWGNLGLELRVPTAQEIKCSAYGLMLEARRLDSNVSSGGLEAYWVTQFDGKRRIGLRFILEYRD